MDLKPLKSTNIDAVGYDHATKTMHVRFKGNGGVYEYQGVEPDDHASFVHDKSPGSHFHQYIRPKFKGQKLESK